jgi:hypothetical protein
MHLYTIWVGFTSYGGFNMPTNIFNQGKPWVRLGLQITSERAREKEGKMDIGDEWRTFSGDLYSISLITNHPFRSRYLTI